VVQKSAVCGEKKDNIYIVSKKTDIRCMLK